MCSSYDVHVLTKAFARSYARKLAFHLYGEIPYEVTYGNQGELWYQEYNGERAIVFNDFEGQGTRSFFVRRMPRLYTEIGEYICK